MEQETGEMKPQGSQPPDRVVERVRLVRERSEQIPHQHIAPVDELMDRRIADDGAFVVEDLG